MRTTLRSVLILGLLAGPALGQEPAPAPPPSAAPKAVVSGKVAVPAGGTIFLDGSGSTSDRPLRWQQVKGAELTYFTFDKSGRVGVALFAPAPEPGVYLIALVATGKPPAPDADIPLDFKVVEITVGVPPAPWPGPVPPPSPGPNPGPVPPSPVPAVGKIYATLVYDGTATDALALQAANLYGDPATGAGLKGLNCDWRAWPKSSANVAASRVDRWLSASGGVGLILYDDQGHVWDGAGNPLAKDKAGTVPLPYPKSPADLIAAVKRLRGTN